MAFQARRETSLFDFIQSSRAATRSKFVTDNDSLYDEMYKLIIFDISNCK